MTSKKITLQLALLLCFTISVNAQVGVGTTSPQETLHIDGTIRADNLTPNVSNSIKLVGVDSDNVFNEVTVGTNLTLAGGVLSASGSSSGGGALNLGITFITDNLANNTFHNYDLDLNGANSDKTVFIFSHSGASPQAFTITGFKGGTDGRVIIIKSNQTNLNINFYDNHSGSSSSNQIQLGSNLSVNGHGSFMLVYSASIQKWVMIGREIP